MKNSFRKISTLILALAVLIGAVYCLSSCTFSGFVYDMVDEVMENGSTEGEKENVPEKEMGNKTEDESGSTDKEVGSSDNSGGSISDGGVEFYPGQGSVPAENISAKNRTLLSTVVIISNFGLTPSAGSGVIYTLDKESGDAYVITNYHVVFNKNYGVCSSASLYLYGMQYSSYAIPATVVGGSVAYDIAVLKVEGSEVLKNSYAMAADFGDSDDIRVFDEVYVVGNPEGYGMAVTEGIVSVDSESLEMTGSDGTQIELRVTRISAAVNEGNSGGGLYSDEGKLIGIVCAKRIGSDVDNMAYAIPSNLAKNLVDNIIYFCASGEKTTVQRAYIGITIVAKVIGIVADSETGEIVKAETIEISELTDTCIAKDKVAVGDIINSITVDGVTLKVTRLHHVTDHMLTARVGSTVVLNITRGGETFDVTVTVPQSAFTSEK